MMTKNKNKTKNTFFSPIIIDDFDSEKDPRVLKELAMSYTKTKRWFYKAEKIYIKLKKMTFVDEILDYEIRLDFAFFLMLNEQYGDSDTITKEYGRSDTHLKNIQESLYPRNDLPSSLLARCYRYQGEGYVYQLDKLVNEIQETEEKRGIVNTKVQKEDERMITVKEEEIPKLIKNAIEKFNDSLIHSIKENNHLEIVLTANSMSKTLKEKYFTPTDNEIIKKILSLYKDHLLFLQPKNLHLDTHYKTTLCLAKLFYNFSDNIEKDLLEENRSLFKEELVFLKNTLLKNNDRHKKIYGYYIREADYIEIDDSSPSEKSSQESLTYEDSDNKNILPNGQRTILSFLRKKPLQKNSTTVSDIMNLTEDSNSDDTRKKRKYKQEL